MTDMTNLRIVAADDDDINLQILQKILDGVGCDGKCFPEGDVTWEYLSEHPNDLDIVILDKMMDTMSGIEIVQKMKEHPILKDVPVILQTGDASPEKIKEGLDIGADRYITKPFSQEQLIEVVEEEMAKKSNMMTGNNTIH